MENQYCVNPSYKLKAFVIGVILLVGVAAKNGYLNETFFSSSDVKTTKTVSFNNSAE
jgi:hypothetical protein